MCVSETHQESDLSTPSFLRRFQVLALPKAATTTTAVARTNRLSIHQFRWDDFERYTAAPTRDADSDFL